MGLTLHMILLLLSFLIFILAALNVPSTRINLLGLGLALLVLAMLVP